MLAVRVISLLLMLMVLVTPLDASANETSACDVIGIHDARSVIALDFVVGADQPNPHDVALSHCSDGWVSTTQGGGSSRERGEDFAWIDAAAISGTKLRPELGPPRTILA